jgi:hypothetical protein
MKVISDTSFVDWPLPTQIQRGDVRRTMACSGPHVNRAALSLALTYDGQQR